MGHAHTSDHARGADRAGTHTDLDCVSPRVDERLCARARGNVAADHVDVCERRVGLESRDDLEHAAAVAIGGVDNENVDAGVAQLASAIPRVTEEADRRAHAQATFVIFRGVGVLLALVEVFDGDEAVQATLAVDQRQLLDLVLGKEREHVVLRDSDGPGDERRRSHDVANKSGLGFEPRHEAHVTVGDDAHEAPIAFDHGETGYAELPAQGIHVSDRRIGRRRDRVRDHSRLRALYLVDLLRLLVNREVAVHDAQATLSRHSNRHARLGHGVHGGRKQRRRDRDAASEARSRVGFARNHVGVRGQQHDVVVGEADESERVGLFHGFPRIVGDV